MFKNTKRSPTFQTLKNLLEGLMFGIDIFSANERFTILRFLLVYFVTKEIEILYF